MNRVLSICLLASTAVWLAGCKSGESARPGSIETVRAHIVESREQQLPVTVVTTGTLHARQRAVIYAQIVARVQEVPVHAGETVKAGQMLAVLDDATLRASADQARAAVQAAESEQAAAQTNAELAASTLGRYRELQAQRSVSPQEFDEVSHRAEASSAQVGAFRAHAEVAKAQESGARVMLAYARVTAPFAGVVTARMADPGSLASPGVPLLQIDSAGPLQLLTTVDESTIGSVRKGMKINVSIDASSFDRSGIVSEIVPAADPASHSFLIKIDLFPSPQLRAGMYATAAIATGTHAAIVVPRSAVVMRGSLPCGYVLDSNGIAQLRYLTLGAPQGKLVEVLSGVSAAEKFVDDPADRDLGGKRIEVQP